MHIESESLYFKLLSYKVSEFPQGRAARYMHNSADSIAFIFNEERDKIGL
jgi:hypothetical protein